MKKKKIGFWHWVFKLIKNCVLYLWNEGPTHRAFLFYIFFMMGFVIFTMIWNPSNDWLIGNQWYIGIMFIPFVYIGLRGIYSCYEEFAE